MSLIFSCRFSRLPFLCGVHLKNALRGLLQAIGALCISWRSTFCSLLLWGLCFQKKKNLDDENLTVSKNWLLPIYIVNVIGAFFLMFPFCIALDYLSQKQFDVFAVGFSILVCEILLLRGQVKWERAVLCEKSLPRFLKYFVCLSNPLRVGATMLFLSALILPI